MLGGGITKAELEFIVRNEMVTEVEDVLIRRSRFTFLNNRESTLRIIPTVAEMILRQKSKDGSINEEELKQMIERGA